VAPIPGALGLSRTKITSANQAKYFSKNLISMKISKTKK
jgi:hypothetical protein